MKKKMNYDRFKKVLDDVSSLGSEKHDLPTGVNFTRVRMEAERLEPNFNLSYRTGEATRLAYTREIAKEICRAVGRYPDVPLFEDQPDGPQAWEEFMDIARKAVREGLQ